jgi:hypothetical protein
MPAGSYTNLALAELLLDAFDTLFGLHLGVKGIWRPCPRRADFQPAG